MIEVKVCGEIEVSADRLWEVVADFGSVPWMQGVTRWEVEGEGAGMARSIFAGDGPPVREVLEFVDDDQHQLGYTINENLPLPVTNYHSVMTVVDLGNGRSRLDWACTGDASDGKSDEEAVMAVEAIYGVMLGWVKTYAES